MHYITHKLSHIFESKQWNIQYNYHRTFNYISSFAKIVMWHPFWSSAPCFHLARIIFLIKIFLEWNATFEHNSYANLWNQIQHYLMANNFWSQTTWYPWRTLLHLMDFKEWIWKGKELEMAFGVIFHHLLTSSAQENFGDEPLPSFNAFYV